MRIINVERQVRLHIDPTELQVGDVMKFPSGDWKVLDIKDNKALIWKCTNVKDHVFNENSKNIYNDSDIQKYLRNDFKENVPMDILERVTIEGFFLLTVEQIRKYMPNELDRIATDEYGRTTGYWIASPCVGTGSGVRSVDTDGNIYINYAGNSYGVAPARLVSLP